MQRDDISRRGPGNNPTASADGDGGPDRKAAAARRRRRARREREAAASSATATRRPEAARRGVLQRLRTGMLRQLQMLIGALGRLSRQPVGSLLTITVIGAALALPLTLLLAIQHVADATSAWGFQAQVSVYLRTDAPQGAGRALAARYEADERVAALEYVSAEQGLAWFRERSDFADLLALLDDADGQPANPLPDTLVVTPAPAAGPLDATVRSLVASLEGEAQVDQVVEDLAWVQRLRALIYLVERATVLAGIGLCIAALLVVANAIRTEVSARRDEILISRLLGASDGFVRQPFVYTGLWYGLGGGLVAVLVVVTAAWLLAAPVARVSQAYGADFAVSSPGATLALLVVSASAALGALSAWLSTERILRSMEPT